MHEKSLNTVNTTCSLLLSNPTPSKLSSGTRHYPLSITELSIIIIIVRLIKGSPYYKSPDKISKLDNKRNMALCSFQTFVLTAPVSKWWGEGMERTTQEKRGSKKTENTAGFHNMVGTGRNRGPVVQIREGSKPRPSWPPDMTKQMANSRRCGETHM